MDAWSLGPLSEAVLARLDRLGEGSAVVPATLRSPHLFSLRSLGLLEGPLLAHGGIVDGLGDTKRGARACDTSACQLTLLSVSSEYMRRLYYAAASE